MSSLLQRELASALSQRDAAKAKIDSFAKIAIDASARARCAADDVETARTALREAAGAHAAGEGSEASVGAARKRVRTAVEAHEIASAEAEGIAERLEPLERDLGQKHDRRISQIAARICVGLSGEIERDALSLAGQLGKLLARRNALAALCFRLDSSRDPLGASEPEFRRAVSRLLGEPIAGEPHRPIVAHVTVEDLLDAPMAGDEPEAIAAE